MWEIVWEFNFRSNLIVRVLGGIDIKGVMCMVYVY